MDRKKYTLKAPIIGNTSISQDTSQQEDDVSKERNQLNLLENVEPLDFESFLSKNKLLLTNDPNREMVNFPNDDVKLSKLPREFRTVNASVPPDSDTAFADNLLARQSIDFFTTQWTTVDFKYNDYGAAFSELPRKKEDSSRLTPPPPQRFEIDEKADIDDTTKVSRTKGPYHEGRLTVSRKAEHSFYLKRREEILRGGSHPQDTDVPLLRDFCIRQLADHTHVLEEIKKGANPQLLYLDSAQSIREIGESWLLLEMRDQPEIYLFTGSKENNLAWLREIRTAMAAEVAYKSSARGSNGTNGVLGDQGEPGDYTDSVRGSLQKYSQETEANLTYARNKDRLKLFTVYPEVRLRYDENDKKPESIKRKLSNGDTKELIPIQPFPLRPEVCRRFKITCSRLIMGLQANVDVKGGSGAPLDNPEPFFTSFSLILASEGRRISEEFAWDPNTSNVSSMLPPDLFRNRWVRPGQQTSVIGDEGCVLTPQGVNTNLANQSIAQCRQCLVSTAYPDDQVYILVRVDKVLQGAVSSATDRYIKSGSANLSQVMNGMGEAGLSSADLKASQQVYRSMAIFANNIGHYRMPFAWAAIPLNSTKPDVRLYKVDPNKLSEDDFIKNIQLMARQDKAAKWTSIPGLLYIYVESVPKNDVTIPNLVSSSLVPVHNSTSPLSSSLSSLSNRSQTIFLGASSLIRELENFLFKPSLSSSHLAAPPSSNDSDSIASSTGLHHSSSANNVGSGGHNGTTGGSASQTLSPDSSESDLVLRATTPEALVVPHLDLVNTLYVYPKCLNFGSQNSFPRARTLSCFVELRDNDDIDSSTPLKVFYTRPSPLQECFDSWVNTSVNYHDSTPSFSDEFKICLPPKLHWKHHLLFRFYHVSCDTAGTSNAREKSGGKRHLETPVGFAFVTLLNAKDNNFVTGSISVPVMVNLSNGYLSSAGPGLQTFTSVPSVMKRRSSSVSLATKPRSASVHFDLTPQSGFHTIGHSAFAAALMEPGPSECPQISWVDNQKPLYTVSLQLKSSIYTSNPHLHRFFQTCHKKLGQLQFQKQQQQNNTISTSPLSSLSHNLPPTPAPPTSSLDRVSAPVIRPQSTPLKEFSLGDVEVENSIKGLTALDLCSLIQFLPPLFNQLLQIITSVTSSEDVPKLTVNTMGVLVCRITGKGPDLLNKVSEDIRNRNTRLLKAYTKYAFDPERVTVYRSQTVHQTLVSYMFGVMRPPIKDKLCCFRLVANNWFFLHLISKSMVVYLCSTNKIKADRLLENRFSSKFHSDLNSLMGCMVDWIIEMSQSQHNKADMFEEAKAANISLAKFVKRLFNLMDRGFVFRLIHDYMTKFEAKAKEARFLNLDEDHDRLCLMKCQFIQQVCLHEHFIQLNLPSLSRNFMKADLRGEFFLSAHFLSHHYLVGLLLQLIHVHLSDTTPSSSSYIRRLPMSILRDQLAKHALDDRFASKPQQARIAVLYLPLVNILIEHKHQFCMPGKNYSGPPAAAPGNTGTLGSSRPPPAQTASARGSQQAIDAATFSQIGFSSISSSAASRPNSLAASETSSLFSGHSSITGAPASLTGAPPPPSTGNRTGASVGSSGSSSSRAYLNKDGKVDANVLDFIASGNNLRRISGRRTAPRGGDQHDQVSIGSTNTLCGALAEEDESGREEDHDLTPEADQRSLTSGSMVTVAEPDPVTPMNAVDHLAIRNVNSGSLGRIRGNANKALTGLRFFPGSRASLGEDGDNLSSEMISMASEDGNRSLPRISVAHQRRALQEAKHRKRIAPNRPAHLNEKCQRDLLVSFIHILSTVSHDCLATFLRNISLQDKLEFLDLIELAVHHVKYLGRESITNYQQISTGGASKHSLPRSSQHIVRGRAASVHAAEETHDDAGSYRSLLEGNLSTQAGLVVLDVIALYCSTFKMDLDGYKADHEVFKKLVQLYLSFLRTHQSETLLRHLFSAIRVFVVRFAKIFFESCSDLVGELCLETLSCLNRRLQSTRAEACGLLYTMMRAANKEYGKQGFNRVHQQIIISVSKLAGNIEPGFELSLSQLNTLAQTDLARNVSVTVGYSTSYKSPTSIDSRQRDCVKEAFVKEVFELTRCIRTVLMANAQMRQHENDPEMLVDLQYSLARSYASNPALRRTWLEAIAKVHSEQKATTEVAMVRIHVSALIAEYLKRRGKLKSCYPQGCKVFSHISPNVEQEESGMRGDSGELEVNYTEVDLHEQLKEAAMCMDQAGLYEVLVHVYRLLIPVHEDARDLGRLSTIYGHLSEAYRKAKVEEDAGHRLFGEYYRVSFYGLPFEQLARKTYIYKTDKCTELVSVCSRLTAIFSDKFGADRVELITEAHVNRSSLDPRMAYIQVTYVEPYFEPSEIALRQTKFEKNFNIKTFMFETPFIKQANLSFDDCLIASGPKRTDDLSAQWKRRTILTTEQSFPNLKRRLEVATVREVNLSPIEGAVDAIKAKTNQLAGHLGRKKFSKLMDMHLQGALLTTVNQGPMAYAETFLKVDNQATYPSDKVVHLKQLFLSFLSTCMKLLRQYEEGISSELIEKWNAMKTALDSYRVQLSNLINEEILVDEIKLTLTTKSVLCFDTERSDYDV